MWIFSKGREGRERRERRERRKREEREERREGREWRLKGEGETVPAAEKQRQGERTQKKWSTDQGKGKREGNRTFESNQDTAHWQSVAVSFLPTHFSPHSFFYCFSCFCVTILIHWSQLVQPFLERKVTTIPEGKSQPFQKERGKNPIVLVLLVIPAAQLGCVVSSFILPNIPPLSPHPIPVPSGSSRTASQTGREQAVKQVKQ